MDTEMALATLLARGDVDDEIGALAPSIHQGVNYGFDDADAFDAASAEHQPSRYYRRYGNPTQARLERLLAATEGGEAALATASGMGAVTTSLMGLLSAGDHVVAQRSMYGATVSWLRRLTDRFDIAVTFVDQADTAAFEAACAENTRLIMLETPSNPTMALTDLAAVVALARRRGILTWADNTVATPINQNPLALGVDIVMHSLTKAISGHADVLGGVLIGRQELIDQLWEAHVFVGAVISPFDAWLALRGLRTLAMRTQWHNRSAQAVAEHLAGHPRIAGVNHPGLSTHPQYDLGRSQMRGSGGLLSFEVLGGEPAAEKVMGAMRLPVRAASLGGSTSTVVRPAALWSLELTESQLAEAGVPGGLIRLAVGLEEPGDLVADLDAALDSLP